MAGTETALEAAGRRYGISPYFMAAAAGTESSFGAAACSNNRMNVWGLSSCGSGWYVPQWSSWSEAISFYARFLTSRWPSARTTYDYHGYAACSSCWGARTAEHMRQRFGVGPSVLYEVSG
jgi:flagellum-specific peptidoglycan hydrolase FlgJ